MTPLEHSTAPESQVLRHHLAEKARPQSASALVSDEALQLLSQLRGRFESSTLHRRRYWHP
jgi:hypothetical protein